MLTQMAQVALLVPDYDDALDFFLGIGFVCREDTDLGDGKRWIRIAPPSGVTEILLARAVTDRQLAAVGEQGGGRVWLFLHTDDLDADYTRLMGNGVRFEAPPRDEAYGRVAVWSDPWGNRWDLIQPAQ